MNFKDFIKSIFKRGKQDVIDEKKLRVKAIEAEKTERKNADAELEAKILQVLEDYYQEKLISGSNIKTVAGNSLLGSGNIDLSNNYQEKLISGSNIKTINNQSLLGSGDITAGKMYLHRVKWYQTYCFIKTSSPTPFTVTTLATYLYNHNYTSASLSYLGNTSASIASSDTSKYVIFYFWYASSTTTLYAGTVQLNIGDPAKTSASAFQTVTTSSFDDTVYEV